MADSQDLTTIHNSQTEGCAIFSHYGSHPGGRRLAAARTGVSDCAGFAPNHKPKAVCHEPRYHSRPATLLRTPFCPFHRSALFLPAAAQVKKETSRNGRKGKNMKLEEVNTRTKEAVDFLVAALESGHSEVLTSYLGAMAKFRNYSFGNIMLIARQKRVSAPLKKADLLTVVHHVIGQLPYNQVPTLAKRHKVEEGKSTKTPQELLAKRVSTYDEAGLCRILLEISLLDSAYQRSGTSDDFLTDAAKRYRVDVEKLQKAVAAEFAANREKSKAKSKSKAVA